MSGRLNYVYKWHIMMIILKFINTEDGACIIDSILNKPFFTCNMDKMALITGLVGIIRLYRPNLLVKDYLEYFKKNRVFFNFGYFGTFVL